MKNKKLPKTKYYKTIRHQVKYLIVGIGKEKRVQKLSLLTFVPSIYVY